MSGYVRNPETGMVHPDNPACQSGCRPVVVIDPEDREQVERLVQAYVSADAAAAGTTHAAMQAALRSFLAPPRPEEPIGLGAVVEEANGRRFVLAADGWLTLSLPGEREIGPYRSCLKWSEVDAARVLFEGVTE